MWWWDGTNIMPGCSGKKNSLASTLTPGKIWTNNYTPSSLHILLLLTHTVPPTSNCWSDHTWTPFSPMLKRPSTPLNPNGQLAPTRPIYPDQRPVVTQCKGMHHTTRMPKKGDTPIPFMKTRSPSYAYTVVPWDTMPTTALPHNPTTPNALFPVTGNLTNFFPSPTSSFASCTTYAEPAPTQPPTMAITPAPYVVMAPTWHATAPGTDIHHLLNKVVTPYNPKAWHIALLQVGLISSFLNLIHDLTYDSPISDPPALSYTFTPKSLSLADIDPAYMDTFLEEEVSSGCMDNPFSMETTHHIFRGHFHTAPLGFTKKPGYNLMPNMASLKGRPLWPLHQWRNQCQLWCHQILLCGTCS